MTSKNTHSIFQTLLPRLVTIVTIVSSMVGCSSDGGFVSVEEKFANDEQVVSKKVKKGSLTGTHYRIKKGDTLYSIAWRFGVDHLTLAEVNGIQSPFTIYPGQEIDIPSSGTSKTRTIVKSDPLPSSAPKVPVIKSATPAPEIPAPIVSPIQNSPVAPSEAVEFSEDTWIWPTEGKLIAQFSTKKPVSKGIDIDGSVGESVLAAAAGTVVYAGRGLRGYGNLVIVKHDDAYLSAYAHTNRILVSEQEIVKAGQKIAEKGSTGTEEVKLHFEIRKNGKPVDPLKYLPKR